MVRKILFFLVLNIQLLNTSFSCIENEKNFCTDYQFVEFSKVDLYKIDFCFVTRIKEVDVFFNLYETEDEKYFFVLDSKEDSATHRIINVQKHLVSLKLYDACYINELPEIAPKYIRSIYFLNDDLSTYFERRLVKGELMYSSRFFRRNINQNEHEIYAGIEKKPIENLYEPPEDVRNLFLISIILPHMNPDYIPYIWIMDIYVPNMLLYEYHEDKMKRLNNAIEP